MPEVMTIVSDTTTRQQFCTEQHLLPPQSEASLNYNLRPHASSDFYKHSFAVSAPATWKPASIRDSVTLVTFKTVFKHISSTPLTRHATDCYPWAPPIHFSVTYGAN